MSENKLEGPCYIGVVGGESENGQCRDSIQAIKKQDGDTGPVFIRATKGFEARQQHLDNWYEGTDLPYILLLDHDMYFPDYTLERLRSHGLPYVSGYYNRRIIPTAPVWFDNGEIGRLPLMPMYAIPPEKALVPIGASGWGCMLIHRDVVTAVKRVLKGEKEIIEDDMDILPYDLKKIMQAISGLDNGTGDPKKHIETLKQEIIPLRVVKDNIGSDIRFPFFAKIAGYQLYGDSGVRCGHLISYPIGFDDYAGLSGLNIQKLSHALFNSNKAEEERLAEARKALEA